MLSDAKIEEIEENSYKIDFVGVVGAKIALLEALDQVALDADEDLALAEAWLHPESSPAELLGYLAGLGIIDAGTIDPNDTMAEQVTAALALAKAYVERAKGAAAEDEAAE